MIEVQPSPFRFVDTEGIPLEMVVERFMVKGYAPELVVANFIYSAIKAGWKPRTIKGVISEAHQIGMPLRPSMIEWARG